MHGKLGALYRLRPNGFKGNGLNDASWGTGFSGASSAYYEVEIDGEGAPDTFKWRKNGGAYTEGVNITGGAQTLDDGQTITFGATTGHTLGDRWVIGNLKDEACTESADEAQITDSTKRRLNPNASPTFTDDGGENVLIVDHTRGKAVFSDNVGAVTVDGNNGYIPEIALEKVGYLMNWRLEVGLDMGDASRMGQQWKEAVPGQAGGRGSAESYFIGGDSFYDAFKAGAENTQKYFLLELFNYDPDQDQTGDHLIAWAVFNSVSPDGPLNEVVKESLGFEVHGIPSFVANA
jgi:hypothetical protein